MGKTILEMSHITKEFPGVKALDDVTFKVEEGEIHCLVGENGAGKSTLMKVLSGVWPHGTYSGDIIFDGQVQKFNSIRDSERAGSFHHLPGTRAYPRFVRVREHLPWQRTEERKISSTGMKRSGRRKFSSRKYGSTWIRAPK